MTVRTAVFTWKDGSQHLLCIMPDGRLTLAHRRLSGEVWSEPCAEDTYYRDIETRPVHEIAAVVAGRFGEVV